MIENQNEPLKKTFTLHGASRDSEDDFSLYHQSMNSLKVLKSCGAWLSSSEGFSSTILRAEIP